MCYECGCGNTKTVMSKNSITDESSKKATEGSGITTKQAKENTLELLKKEIGKK